MTCVPNGIGTKSTIDCFYDRMTGTSRRIMTPGNVYTVDVTYEARLMTPPGGDLVLPIGSQKLQGEELPWFEDRIGYIPYRLG